MRREGLLDLNEAVQNPGKRLNFEVQTELPNEEDIDLIAPIAGSIKAVSVGNALLLDAEFTTKIVVECARCANPIEKTLKFTMQDEFEVEGVPSCYASDGYAKVINEEPHHIFEKNALMQDVYIRQGLILNLPTQPLCTDSWDIPCPNSSDIPDKQPSSSGHPAMQLLEQFRRDDNE